MPDVHDQMIRPCVALNSRPVSPRDKLGYSGLEEEHQVATLALWADTHKEFIGVSNQRTLCDTRAVHPFCVQESLKVDWPIARI